jgi:catechol 2,3-dioxygenase-like lactoylglutathione lyase family enzyme
MTEPTFSSLVPMVPVTNVPRTIKFYEQLGFQVGNTHTPDGLTEPVWAWLYCGEANVMINLSEAAIEAAHDSTSVWLYCSDVTATHQLLASRGLDVGEISHPFYNPGGEFHVHDPDGYAIFVTHTGVL